MLGELTKFAVIVPAAPTVEVVEALVDETKVIEGAEDVHDEKAYPELGLATIDKEPPAFTHAAEPEDGVVVPPVLAAIVI